MASVPALWRASCRCDACGCHCRAATSRDVGVARARGVCVTRVSCFARARACACVCLPLRACPMLALACVRCGSRWRVLVCVRVAAMRWVACEAAPDLLGSREGHCAAIVAVAADEGDAACGEAVVVVGGYGDGALSAAAIAAPLATLPRLRWCEPAVVTDDGGAVGALECDGASLTRVRPDTALLFGGLDAQYERRNAVFALRLAARRRDGGDGDAAWCLHVRALAVTGDAPAPRSRHAAGAGYDDDSDDARLYVFGGDTDAAAQTSDMYALSLATCVWRRVVVVAGCGGGALPPPRVCCPSLPFVARGRLVLYGGAHFADGGDLASYDDVWLCDVRRRDVDDDAAVVAAWSRLSAASFARSNGHCGVRLRRADGDGGVVVFVGGKDVATGCDDVRVVSCDGDRVATSVVAAAAAVSVPCHNGDDDDDNAHDAPHWRYAAAAVAVADGGVLLLAGQCRHPQRVAAYLLRTDD